MVQDSASLCTELNAKAIVYSNINTSKQHILHWQNLSVATVIKNNLILIYF